MRIVLLLCTLLLVARVAHAAPSVATQLTAAEAAFDDQDYERVVTTLRPVLAGSDATRAQRLRALELTALSQYILGDPAAARVTFERLLDIDPGYQLRDDSGSPKLQRFFDEVKQDVVPGFEPDLVAELDHAAPPEATAGRRLEVDIRATTGTEHVKEVVMFVRRRGDQDYAPLTAAFRGDARWRIRYTAPSSIDAYTLEYYLEGRGLTGAAVARVASPEAPLTIAITGATPVKRTPWYRRWYTLAGAGAVVIGATTAILLATSGTDDGTLPPGRVVVSP